MDGYHITVTPEVVNECNDFYGPETTLSYRREDVLRVVQMAFY